MGAKILDVRDLVTRFHTPDGIVHAVNGVSFQVNEGETLGIVGESGCGKSVTMLSLLGLIPQPPGKIERGSADFQGKDLLKLSSEDLRYTRGAQIAMIFQDPMTSLNPSMTIGSQISEALVEHKELSGQEARAHTVELLEMVGIPNAKQRIDNYPHQFSGGMRQRVMIAMALSCQPKILIADEPTTALDVTIQAQIVELVKKIRDEFGMAVIWITHDLGIIAGLAERVMVMYAGYIVEHAPVFELYRNPRHPYTIGLLGAVPRIVDKQRKRLVNIEGQPPDLYQEAHMCPFAPRCAYAVEQCWQENPILRTINNDHQIACWVDVEKDTSAVEVKAGNE